MINYNTIKHTRKTQKRKTKTESGEKKENVLFSLLSFFTFVLLAYRYPSDQPIFNTGQPPLASTSQNTSQKQKIEILLHHTDICSPNEQTTKTMSLITMNTFIHDSINRMMNTYTMDLIRLFADKHHFNANEAYDAFMNSLRNNNVSLSKTESNTTVSEPALSEPALSHTEPVVVDTEKSANKGRPKKVKESIIENHEDSEDDEELENVNTVIKRLMESHDNEEVEAEEEIELFQSEELIEYTAAADKKETPHAHIEKEKVEDKKASLEKDKDKEDKAAASKRDKEEKAAALKRDKEEKAAALKRDKEEKEATLKREKEEKAAALKRDKEEKAAALKRDKEEKAAALKRDKEDKKTSEKKKTTKKNENTEDKNENTQDKNEKTQDKNTQETKETTEKNEKTEKKNDVITTHDITLDLTEEEYEEEDEQQLPAKKFTFKGKVYLKGCDTNVIYDKDTQDVIGEWEEKTNTIYFIM